MRSKVFVVHVNLDSRLEVFKVYKKMGMTDGYMWIVTHWFASFWIKLIGAHRQDIHLHEETGDAYGWPRKSWWSESRTQRAAKASTRSFVDG